MRKRFILISILLMLLCSCNTFKITGAKEAIESSEQTLANLSKDGYLKDNVYYYPILNIKFNIPKNLRLLTDKEINLLTYGSTEKPANDNNVVTHEFFALNIDNSSNISLTSDKPNIDIDFEDYVDMFYSSISANSDVQGTIVSKPAEYEICDQKYIRVTSAVIDKGRTIDTFITHSNNIFISIQIMYNSEENVDDFLALIEPIE